MVVGIGYHGDGNLIILDENLNAQNYVKTLSENFLDSTQKHVWRPKSSMRVSTWQCSSPHNWRTVTWLEQQEISTMQWPYQSPTLNIKEQVWDFTGRAIVRVMPVTWNDLIRALHKPWLSITVPYLHNLYNPLPRRVRAVTRGRGYPTKYWLTKYFHSKDNIWICLTSPERIFFATKCIQEITFYFKFRRKTSFNMTFSSGSKFVSGECR